LNGSAAGSSQWVRYWRFPDIPVEAMRARFTSHVYHRHSHDTYSFGVTEDGAQAFACRQGIHVSTTGLVMAFNPGDPHDGHAGDSAGFTYRMVHVQPEYLSELLPGHRGWPLFRTPVIDDPALAQAVMRLHMTLTRSGAQLARHEALTAAASLLLRHASGRWGTEPGHVPGRPSPVAVRVRELIHDAARDVSIEDLASAAGCSRYAAYRAFVTAYGLTPSEYHRQLRLSAARRLLASGVPPAHAAAEAGFADQAHLTRWFRRCYGITPAAFVKAVS
jgi:AraC-like DNA-binding protein